MTSRVDLPHHFYVTRPLELGMLSWIIGRWYSMCCCCCCCCCVLLLLLLLFVVVVVVDDDDDDDDDVDVC